MWRKCRNPDLKLSQKRPLRNSPEPSCQLFPMREGSFKDLGDMKFKPRVVATGTLYAALSYAAQAQELNVSVGFWEGRTTEVSVSGAAGGWLVLEASSDLQGWSELVKAPATGQTFIYLDYVAEIFAQRFYRAIRFKSAPNDNFAQRQILLGTNVQATSWTFSTRRKDWCGRRIRERRARRAIRT